MNSLSIGLRALCLWFLGTSLVGCSLLETRPRTAPAGPMVRDVPYQNRDAQGLRQRVLVLPFINAKSGNNEKLTEAARGFVVNELARSGRFVVINNSDLPHDPKKFLTEEGEYNMEELSRLGAGLGVAAVIEGKVMDVRARRLGDNVGLFRELKAEVESTVRVRVFATRNAHEILLDVRSAKAETSTTRVGENSYSDRHLEQDPRLVLTSLRQAYMGSLPQIVRALEKLTWQGRVAMVSGERVFVNAGRLSGLQIGDILKITEEGDEVFDPDNGRFIGRAPGRMKGTIEVVSYFGKDGAIAIVHSGSGFKENDRVELY